MNQPRVHILATCRRPELLRATTLVFDTLRVGFPTAEVHVYDNNLPEFASGAVYAAAEATADADVHPISAGTMHHHWIDWLLQRETEPFWILDTDVVFFDSFEKFNFGGPLNGARIPEFNDPVTQTRTMERLHTSLLRFDPEKIRQEIALFKTFCYRDLPGGFTPLANLINPVVLPSTRHPGLFQTTFYDTCAMLCHVVEGRCFSEEQLDAYAHLHSGTISDLTAHLFPPDVALREKHFAIFENPELARGLWRQAADFYRRHAP